MRISRGRHASPDEGACVLELVSMLAGERFSDNPRCADPVLSAFLRAFNDRLDHANRQRLVAYAPRIVGTRGSRRRRRERLDMCLAFTGQRSHLLARARITLLVGVRWGLRLEMGAPEYAARCAIAEGRADAGFALLDRLIGSEPAPLAGAVVVGPQLRVAGAGAQLELDPH